MKKHEQFVNNYNYPILPSPMENSQEDYYKKMMDVKNGHIEKLLEELRETKDLYQQYKQQYMNSESTLKSKVSQLTTQVQQQSTQLQKYKQINTKLRNDLTATSERQKKLIQAHQNHIKQLRSCSGVWQDKIKRLTQQNEELSIKNEVLQQKYSNTLEQLKKKQAQSRLYQIQTVKWREQLTRRENQWKQQRRDYNEKLQQIQRKRAGKQKINSKLDALQNRIKHTLMNI